MPEVAWLTRVLSLFLLMCATVAQAETWSASGLYSVKTDGWTRAPVAADVSAFSCQTCGQRVDVIIGYGAPGPPGRSNEEFLRGLATDVQRQRHMAGVVEAFKAKGQTFEVLQVQLGRIAGVQALQYNGKISAGATTTYVAVFVFVHKQRQFQIQMGSLDRPPPPETLRMVNAFLATFTLEK